MKFLLFLLLPACFLSCTNRARWVDRPIQKMWGYKPVYASVTEALKVTYMHQKMPVQKPGNIYAFGNLIFQMDVGRGIHVIDNSNPATADRIGFISINGCSEISIRGNYLYTNSVADLVTIDLSDTSQLKVVNRVKDALPNMRYNYPLSRPSQKGYFDCPNPDSIVVNWVQDSVYAACYNN